MPIWLLYVAPAVVLAVVFVLVARSLYRKADNAARMRNTIARIELEASKQKRDADSDAGAAS